MAKSNPRVLIVNDDGIDAPGIVLLEKIVRELTDDIWVVAPDEEKSGAGHSLSTYHPMRVKLRDERHIAVKGTPTDCALLGVYEFLADKKPDVILSGINRGPNLAEDITYSGTASAAMEGAMLGIPAIALSQKTRPPAPVHWATAEAHAGKVIARLLEMDWRAGTFINVNFPDCPPEDVRGLRVTTQGLRPPGTFKPVRRVDERHVPYYWTRIDFPDGGHAPGNDLQAVLDNEISVTPLQLNMTDREAISGLERLFSD
ncbi:MAG: 5'/3'-nucleotidase SurE [Novosphingobium sp.]|nr:5'/3'-nucleotidase SurE [Novosphingobium sp.]